MFNNPLDFATVCYHGARSCLGDSDASIQTAKHGMLGNLSLSWRIRQSANVNG